MAELGLTISQLVAMMLPAGFSVSEEYLDNQIKIWQMLVWEAAGVPEEEKYETDSYSDEWQVLLAYLLVYSIYQRILAGAFIVSTGGTSNETSSEGGIKKITTGPTEVEYHDASKSLSEVFKTISGPGGLMEQLMSIACPLGSKLGIKLPFCPGNGVGICFKIARGKSCCASSSAVANIICHETHKPVSMG